MKASPLVQRSCLLPLLLSFILFVPLVYSVQLSERFKVKQGTDKGGTDNVVGVVQKWLDDTVTLVDFLTPKFPDNAEDVDGGDGTLRRNLKSWFNLRLRTRNGIHPDDVDAYLSLRQKIFKLDGFLKGTEQDWNQESNKPWLFYNSGWQEETDRCYDDDGAPLDTDGRAVTGNPSEAGKKLASLRDWYPPNFDDLDEMEDQDKKALYRDMKERENDDWKYFAYWSSDLKDYQLISQAERRRPGGFCDAGPDEDFFALTIGNMYVDSVTLCEPAFTEKAELHETINDGMSSEAATSNTGGTALEKTSPRSLTLLHELIHMTSDPDATPDEGTKPTECLELVKNMNDVGARNNPDSIAFFAWSYYLEKNGDPSFRWNTGKKVKQ